MGAEYLGESLASDHLSVKRVDLGLLAFRPGWGSGGLLPGRVVSESEGMPGAAILLETHTHKNRACAFFCRGCCCSWEGAEAGKGSQSLWTGSIQNDSPLKMLVERSWRKGPAWWVLWCLLVGISNPQESVRNPISEY